jgi:hypothetical protein
MGRSTIYNHLELLVQNGEANEEEIREVDLPVGEVLDTEAYGGMKYPNQMFFSYVAMIEKACHTGLTANRTVVHGPYIVEELRCELIASSNMQSLIRDCLLLELNEDVSDVTQYLVRTYMRMRGKDFVRRIMSASRRSRSTQNCHKQAVLITPKLSPKKSKNRRKKVPSRSVNEIYHDENIDGSEDERNHKWNDENSDGSEHERNEEKTDDAAGIQDRIMFATVQDIVNTPEEEDEGKESSDEDNKWSNNDYILRHSTTRY